MCTYTYIYVQCRYTHRQPSYQKYSACRRAYISCMEMHRANKMNIYCAVISQQHPFLLFLSLLDNGNSLHMRRRKRREGGEGKGGGERGRREGD